MIFDSGLHNMPKGLFDKEYCKILEDLASVKDEYELDRSRVFTLIHPYLQSYVQGFLDFKFDLSV